MVTKILKNVFFMKLRHGHCMWYNSTSWLIVYTVKFWREKKTANCSTFRTTLYKKTGANNRDFFLFILRRHIFIFCHSIFPKLLLLSEHWLKLLRKYCTGYVPFFCFCWIYFHEFFLQHCDCIVVKQMV